MANSSFQSAAPPAVMSAFTLACGAVSITLRTLDTASADWLREFLHPWFVPSAGSPGLEVMLDLAPTSEALAGSCDPKDSRPRGCFVFDQGVLSLPSWSTPQGICLHDAERRCWLTLSASRIRLRADRRTRRWRMTLLWTFCEFAANALRNTCLDLHAAAVASQAGAVAICGPKGSAKTTLILHLLRSGRCRLIANDRVFVDAGRKDFACRGLPTAVKIRPETLATCPALPRNLSAVQRPYLYSLKELRSVPPWDAQDAPADFFALSPAQFTGALGACAVPVASLCALLFPQLDSTCPGWALEKLAPDSVRSELWRNPYGQPFAERPSTIFEELGGRAPASSPDWAAAVAASIPGYRLRLGPDAYAQPDFAARLLQAVSAA